MDAVHAVGEQIDDLLHRVGDAGVAQRLGLALIALHDLDKLGRQACAAERDHALDLPFVGDGHDASLDRHADAGDLGALQKAVEHRVVKKQLADQVLRTGVHLLFEVEHVLCRVGCVHVHLRIAGAAHVKIAVRTDIGAQLARIAKILLRRHALRIVAAQREDVFNPVLAKILQRLVDHGARAVDAGQVRHGLHTEIVFDLGGDLAGAAVCAAAARAVGDADKVGLQGADLFELAVDRLDRRILFGREHLERKDRLVPFEQCIYLHSIHSLAIIYLFR